MGMLEELQVLLNVTQAIISKEERKECQIMKGMTSWKRTGTSLCRQEGIILKYSDVMT
jgi:hypothetical protein